MNLLIVDDDPTTRALVKEMLREDTSIRITEAANGAEAWELLDDPSRYFDALVLDVQMAPVNGLELLARIRNSAMINSTPVILCTATSDRSTVTQAIQLEIRHYLVKPLAKAAVLQKIEQVKQELEQKSQRRLSG